MTNIQFQKIQDGDRKIIHQWLSEDAVGSRFIASYKNFNQIMNLVDFKNRFFWIAKNDNNPIGFFDLEIEKRKKGCLAFYIAPEFRGKGLGLKVLLEALELPELKDIKVFEGGVNKENETSRKVLEKAGFRIVETDDADFLIYRKEQEVFF